MVNEVYKRKSYKLWCDKLIESTHLKTKKNTFLIKKEHKNILFNILILNKSTLSFNTL